MKKAILISKREITRNDGSKAYPLNEDLMPKGNGSPQCLIDIVDFLNVEKSLRYKRNEVGGKVVATYCNIYAFDYCNLAGGYLPRVWWNKSVIEDIKQGKDIDPVYSKTVSELNANSLYDWFKDYSLDFGWQKQNDLYEAQQKANAGYIVIIVAKQKIVSRSGHITVIVPETKANKSRSINKTFLPLQSQSGLVNQKYFTDNWFVHPRYEGFGVYALKTI